MGLPVTYQSKVRPWSQVSLLSVMSSGVYPPQPHFEYATCVSYHVEVLIAIAA